MTHLPDSQILNRFMEDSCVLVTLAYLLSRGALPSVFDPARSRRDQIIQAVVFGLLGASEILFPGDRYPYITFTLATAFAGYTGGLTLGLLTAGTTVVLASVASVIGVRTFSLPAYVLSVFPASLIGTGVAQVQGLWKPIPAPRRGLSAALLGGAFVAGAAAEIAHLLLQGVVPAGVYSHGAARPAPVTATTALYSMGANGFGCLLLALVLRDAYERQLANRRRVAAETALATLRLRQMSELQARLHPHFLFNTLSTIAGLCTFAPDKAEAATVQLGELMRHALEGGAESAGRLGDEIRHARLYVGIEEQRYGPRIQVVWDVAPGTEGALVPQFAVQTLVENAVSHGIEPQAEPGQILVSVRRYPHHVLVAVRDTGAGMSIETRRGALVERNRPHGLVILMQQLTLQYGRAARVRLFSREGVGTLAAFVVPAPTMSGPTRPGKGEPLR